MDTPGLKTERLMLRPLCRQDAKEAYENWTSDSEVAKFMNWSLHQSQEDTMQWLCLEEENCKSPTNYTWGFVLLETGELIGSGGVNWNEEQRLFELGYNIMRKHWGRGLTTEAAAEIVRFSRDELGITRIYARHAIENPASGAVMRKLGFVPQRESSYTCWDGVRSFACREYLLEFKGGKQ